MNKVLVVGLLALLLALSVAVPVLAENHGSDGAPNGTCPLGFDHAHAVDANGMHVDQDHGPHQHVGNSEDRNSDGWICVKHAGVDGSIHVHADNNYRRGQR